MDLHPSLYVSLGSQAHIFNEMKTPSFEYSSLIPRKYLSFPRSLISNFAANFFFSSHISIGSFLVMIISSTYTSRTVNYLLGNVLEKVYDLLGFAYNPWASLLL